MDRRAYIAAAMGVLTTGSAGCLRLSTDDSGTPAATGTTPASETAPADTPTQTETPGQTAPDIPLSGTVPDWAAWIPTDLVGDAQVTSRNYEHARSTWPEGELGQPNADIADQYGTVNLFSEVTGDDPLMSVYRGTFDTEAILAAFDATPEQTASYRGFDIIDKSERLALDGTTLVFTRPQTVLDARYGERASLGTTADGWETVLSATADSPWLTASTGAPELLDDTDLSADVRANATTRSYELGAETSATYLLFDSAENARAVERDDAAKLALKLVPQTAELDTLERAENVLVIRYSQT